ncbi:MAG: Uma2 family endonuclease [Acidobacteria bacterium]|nr:Uma2 family endonuclease [Acidobacteriota bacterium]
MLVKVSEDFALNFPLPELSDAEFFRFCLDNKEYRIERSAEGRIEIMSNTGGKTSNRNAALTAQMYTWALADGRGVSFDSGALFNLPSTAMRSPDGAWTARDRLSKIRTDDPEGILPICPEFVVELASKTDRLNVLQAKMREWMDAGCELGWLIVPATKTVYVYRAGSIETLVAPAFVEGSGPVEGFKLNLDPIWEPPGW